MTDGEAQKSSDTSNLIFKDKVLTRAVYTQNNIATNMGAMTIPSLDQNASSDRNFPDVNQHSKHPPRRKPPPSMDNFFFETKSSSKITNGDTQPAPAKVSYGGNSQVDELAYLMSNILASPFSGSRSLDPKVPHNRESVELPPDRNLDSLTLPLHAVKSDISGETDYYSNCDSDASFSSLHEDTSNAEKEMRTESLDSNSLPYPLKTPSVLSSDEASKETIERSSHSHGAQSSKSSSETIASTQVSSRNSEYGEPTPIARKESPSVVPKVSLRRGNGSLPQMNNAIFRSNVSPRSLKLSKQDNNLDHKSVLGEQALKNRSSKTDFSIHKKSNSVNSVWSSYSQRHINLSVLRKNLDLHPGEGERSNYIYTLRKNCGTAYNESLPGKWKLPIGILPIDRKNYALNPRFMRHAGGTAQGRNKKSSGVELKHGHLEPRLLATEVGDPNDSLSTDLKLEKTFTSSSITARNSVRGLKSSSSSLTVSNGTVSNEANSSKYGDDAQSLKTTAESASSHSLKKQISISSSSSGSISDLNYDGYYQHEAYLNPDNYDDDDNNNNNDELQNNSASSPYRFPNDSNLSQNSEKPKLVLANPDDSD